MKIKECFIEGFGQFRNHRQTFDDGLNVILAENGYGKTTLSVFIRVMLFGMEAKRAKESMREKYRPWDGGKYGGSIIFEYGGKCYRAERYFNETESKDFFALYDEETGMRSADFSQNLGRELFLTDKETYQKTAFIPFGKLYTDELGDSMALIAAEGEHGSDTEGLKKAISTLSKAKTFYNKRGGKIAELSEKISLLSDKIAFIEAFIKDAEPLKEKIKGDKKALKEIKERRLSIKGTFHTSAAEEEVSFFEERIAKNISLMKKMPSEAELTHLKKLTLNYKAALSVAENKRKEGLRTKKLLLSGAVFFLLLAVIALTFKFYIGFIATLIVCFILSFTALHVVFQSQNASVSDDAYEKLSSYAESFTSASPETAAEVLDKLTALIAADREALNAAEKRHAAYAAYEEKNLLDAKKLDDEEERLMSAICLNEAKCKSADEKSASLYELYAAFDDTKKRLEDAKRRAHLIEETEMLLNRSSENLSTRYASGIRSEFSKLRDFLSAPKGARVNSDFSVSVEEGAALRSDEDYSSGERDAIYLALRFSVIKALYTSELPPVVMDDSLVCLDSKKQAGAKKLILKLSEQYQIFYFTCDEKRAEF